MRIFAGTLMSMLLQHSPLNVPLRVVDVSGSEAGMLRVQELGVLPGTVITVLRRAPFGGPLDVMIGRVRIGIRPDTHLRITVEPLPQGVA
jgi:Fe2+ transport system protein FeoA